MTIRVRSATLDDVDEIFDIWLEGIERSLGGPPPGGHDYRAYFRDRIEKQDDIFRYFVSEGPDGQMISRQSLSPFRSNPAIASHMAELSAYARAGAVAGRATEAGMDATFQHADASPLEFIVAFVAAGNEAATRMCRAHGMEVATTLPASRKDPEAPRLQYLVYPCRPPT